ncbi:hypothetical protein ABEF95_014960 [Exophiala dermatitidis]
MSDHEGEGLNLDRWEEASLPGATSYSYAPSEAINKGIAAVDGGFAQPAGARGARAYVPRGQPGVAAETSVRPAQQHSHDAHQVRGGPSGRHVASGRPPVNKSAAQIRFEGGIPPDAEYHLPSNWRAQKTKTLRMDRASRPHPLRTLQEIMLKFGTYIKKPEEQDDRLFIWGTQQQIIDTKAALEKWQEELIKSKDNNPRFAKSTAVDGRLEHRVERQSKKQAFHDLLKQASIDYQFEAAFLWPRELDIEEFATHHADTLDQLRSTYNCYIGFHAEGVQHITIGAHYEKDIMNIMKRVLNLIKELVGRRDQLTSVNLVQLPDVSVYRDRVGLEDKDPLSDSYLPTLHGKPAPDEAEWAKERRLTNINNRKKMKKTIDTAIKRLRISQQHVRMRVVLGELGFKLFQKPPDGSTTYSFEDFYLMATKGRSKLSMNSLPVRQGDITELADILDGMEEFHDAVESYGAYFDFPAANSQTILRLETVINPIGDDSDEYEMLGRRWVEIDQMVSRLQLSVFNFERPDYQITMDAFPMHVNKARSQMMAQFGNNVSFIRPKDGIKAIPHRRIRYPAGQRGLTTVSEITVKKWRFKDTDAFFELRRKEVYDDRITQYSPHPVETKWHALYYYPEWDNLMGEFANVQAGEDVTWVRSVATFFPEGGVDDGRALPLGFKKFVSEVEELQDLLAKAMNQIAAGAGTSSEGDDATIVNGASSFTVISQNGQA